MVLFIDKHNSTKEHPRVGDLKGPINDYFHMMPMSPSCLLHLCRPTLPMFQGVTSILRIEMEVGANFGALAAKEFT